MTLGVLIVDDSAIVRRGVRALLETDPGLAILGEAGDGEAALAAARELSPDVVLLDVRMPNRDGLSVVGELSQHSKVLMLTFSDEPHIIRGALEAGAAGYLVHGTFDADSLAATVRSAAAGMTALSAPAAEVMRTPHVDEPSVEGNAALAAKWGLSPRQVDVMTLVAAGRTNHQIAQELFLSEKTVKNHINQLFAKLQVSSRGAAIALWLGH